MDFQRIRSYFHSESRIRKYSLNTTLISPVTPRIPSESRFGPSPSSRSRTFYRTSDVFSVVDAGSGGDGGGDESEHVASRGPHGGRHRRSRARRRPDAVVAAPATVEPTRDRLSPRLSRRGHPWQSGGDHVELLVRHGHRRVVENHRRPSASRVIGVDSRNLIASDIFLGPSA